MLSLHDTPATLCDGLSRREWLRVGGLALGGLSLPALLQSRASGAAANVGGFGRAKSCIVIFLLGGPPQHETWDPKPDAPAEVRGPFNPIATKVPGIQVCELMPKLAGHVDQLAILRAMSTNDNAHSSSGYWMLTGTPHSPMNSENAKPGAPNDWPSLGALVQHLRPSRGGLPAAITVPEHIWNTGRLDWPGQTAGWLGRRSDPWLVTCDPSAPNFDIPDLKFQAELPPLRVDQRSELLSQIDRHLDVAERSGSIAKWSHQRQQAFDLLRSASARRAFRLEDEQAATRDRYGRTRFGQSVLLARRLVESGVSLVQVNWTRPATDQDVNPVWDTHANNAPRMKNDLMPPMDQAVSALLEDLARTGRLAETLVAVVGEFGRSPRINAAGGRDHWGHVFSIALAGGGIQGGRVVGASDRLGGFPVDGRHEPQDFGATVLHLLGIPPHTLLHDRLGRPIAVSRGEPIRAIL